MRHALTVRAGAPALRASPGLRVGTSATKKPHAEARASALRSGICW